MRRMYDRVDIQTPPTGVGDRGQRTGSWETLHGQVPSSVIELSGKELELARQYVPTATHSILIRWHDNVTEECRVVWEGRNFGIGHVKNPDPRNNRNNFLKLFCEEKKA
jgi:SPP1 family predicted phage head-tail adaptor